MSLVSGLRRTFLSLRTRMVIMYLLLILLAMEVIGNYLLFSLRAYYLRQQLDDMRRMGEVVSGFAARSLEQTSGQLTGTTLRDLDNLVRMFSQKDLSISIADREGMVISTSSDEAGPARLPRSIRDVPEVRQVLEGGLASTPGIRSDPATGKRRAFLAMPVAVGGRITGVVYLVGSLERIEKTLAGMKGILFSATLIALILSAILSYILARTITGPVKELTERAAALAGGDFERLIRVRSEDEIGRLAGMFNHLSLRLKDTLEEISTEKQKAEAILKHMTDGIIAVDHKGYVVLINPAASAMTGVRPEAAIGRPFADVFRGTGLEGLAGSDGGTVVRIAPPGPGLVLKAEVAPIREEGHRPSGVVVVLHDITQQERLDQMRKEFVANVSHELRTPLTTIKSYIETLLDEPVEDPELSKRFLGVVAGETERMIRLVNDLLTLSHLDSGRLLWDKRPMMLDTLVREVGEKFAERCSRKGLVLKTDMRGPFPQVLGDRDRLEQVLSNLLNNAVDFTPAGGVIGVTVGSEGGWVTVTVSDTGVGIPPEDLPRIFERFYRVDKARSREYGGTGLGLSIAKEIVEAHGGEISIRSEPGRGTEVTLALPAIGDGIEGQPQALTG